MGGISKSIPFKWVIFSVLLATLPLVIAGIHIARIYQKDLTASVVAIEEEKASRVVEETRNFIERAKSNLLLIAKNQDITRSSLAHAKSHLQALLYQNDYLLNEKGLETVRVSKLKTEKIPHQKDQSDSPMFQVASKGGIFYGDFYYNPDGRPAIIIAVPTERYGETATGVLKAGVDVGHLQEEIEETKIHERGFAYVVDKEGFLIVRPREAEIQFGPFVDRVIAGEEGNIEYENPKGESFLVVYKPISELKWGVIAQVPMEEVYGPIEKMTGIAFRWL